MDEISAVRLTPRLQLIADQIAQDAVLADIGTDHAHLPIYLMQQNRIRKAIASDIRQGPLERAKYNIEKYGYSERICTRLGAGLEQVAPEECDTISIAGMGGETIAQILQDASWTNAAAYTVFVQPMTMIFYLRQWLWQNGYEILQEFVCQEEHRHYVVMKVQGGAMKQQIPLGMCCVSPALLAADGAKEYLQAQLQKESRALAGLKQANRVDKSRLDEQELIVKTLTKGLEELL